MAFDVNFNVKYAKNELFELEGFSKVLIYNLHELHKSSTKCIISMHNVSDGIQKPAWPVPKL